MPLTVPAAKAAVTPLGRPDAESVTLPANPFAEVTVMVSALLVPWLTERVPAAGASVKLGGGFTVSAIVVDAVEEPEVPVIVTGTGPPRVAVLRAVSVSTLEPVVGLVAKPAVTPVGKPVAVRVTAPVNPPASPTVMVSVLLLPSATDIAGAEGESVKPEPIPLTVTVPALLD